MFEPTKRQVARFAVVVMIVGLLSAWSTAEAATPTLMKDAMNRVQASATAVTHSVSMTLPTGGIPNTQTLTLTYAGFTAFAGSPTATCGAGTASAAAGSGNVLTITGSGSGCSTSGGTLTVTGFTGTNPSSTGSNTVTLAGSAGITGTFAVTTVTSDQVTVTASIDPSITFNVGAQAAATACDGTFSGNGGTVALGALTTGAVATSDASSVQHICTRITTNAGSGAAVSVRSTNAALASTGTPADTIASSTATLVAGTSGYGLCAGSAGGDSGRDSTTPTGSAPAAASPFNTTCTSAAHGVGALTTGAQNVWTVAAASQNAFFRLYVKAAISGTVPAHSDYTDTLTFVGTGTF